MFSVDINFTLGTAVVRLSHYFHLYETLEKLS